MTVFHLTTCCLNTPLFTAVYSVCTQVPAAIGMQAFQLSIILHSKFISFSFFNRKKTEAKSLSITP